MAIEELATAVVQVIPSALGIEANLAKQFAPAQGIATAQGATAGKAFGGQFGSQFKKMLPTSFQGISFGPLLGSAVVAGVVVGLAEIGGAVSKMRRVIAQESGATGDHLNALFETAKREATDVPAKFDDIAEAVSELERRGVPLGATFDKLAKQELFLAKITKSEIAPTVESTTALMGKFNVPLKEQSRELDVLFKGTQLSGKGLSDLIDPLLKGGTALRQFGFSLDESIALTAGLAKSGGDVMPVLQSLRRGFAQIAKEGKDPKTVLRDIITSLQNKDVDALPKALKLFGARGGAEFVRAIQEGKLNVDALLKSITNGKDGIIATGEATLTLADRIQLLKNRAAVALAPLGSQIRTVFSDIVSQATPAFTSLFGAIANAATGLLPVLTPIGIAAAGLFKGAIPVLQFFADGLNTVGDALHAIPGPVLAVVGAVGGLALAFAALKLALVTGAITSFIADLNPVTATLVVTAAAITALGAVMKLFGGQADAVKKETKALASALFDASGDAGIFAEGITSAGAGLRSFLESQIKAGKDSSLADTLAHSGTSVDTLVSALSTGDKAWKQFTNDIVKNSTDVQKAGKAVDKSFTGLGSSNLGKGLNQQTEASSHFVGASQKVIDSLNKERDAFKLSSEKQLVAVQATGQLTTAQVKQLKQQTANGDGSVNYARLLDAVDKKLASVAAQTDSAAQATADSNPVYAELADQFALGTLSADQFATILQDKFKFTAEGAKAAVKNLGEQVKTLAGEIDKAFPPVSAAAKDLKNNVVRASDDIATRQAEFVRQQQQVAAQGGTASKQLADAMSTNLHHIQDDFATLAANKDPEKFTTNLLHQAQNISRFFANLHTLIAEGFPQLARQLLDLGVEGGGQLAAGFANDKNRAAAGENAAKIVEQAKINARQQGLADFSAYQGIGKLLPQGVAEGITDKTGKTKVGTAADSIGPFVRKRFGLGPQGELYGVGHEAGGQIDQGVADGITAGTSTITTAINNAADSIKRHTRGAFRIESPSKWARDEVGIPIVQGVAEGLDPKPVEPAVNRLSATIKNITSQVTGAIPTVVSGALSDFINAAIGQLPSVGSEISDFSSNLVSALDSETQALADYQRIFQGYAKDRAKVPVLLAREREAAELLHAVQVKLFTDTATGQSASRLAADAQLVANAEKAVAAAREKLAAARSKVDTDRGDVADATKTLNEAKAALAAASNVGLFNAGLRASKAAVIQFQGNLQKLVKLGLTDLARNLAEQGPEAAGALAASLARNAKAARAAEKNIDRAKTVAANFQTFLAKNFAGLGGTAVETGQSVGADLLAGIKDFLKAGGNADVVSAQISKILNPDVAKKAGETAGAAAGSGLTDSLIAATKDLATFAPTLFTGTTKLEVLQPKVIAPVKTAPVAQPTITQAIHDAITIDTAATSAPPPQKLEIELVSSEDLFEPVRVAVDLPGQRITRMRAAVKAKVQAIGSPA